MEKESISEQDAKRADGKRETEWGKEESKTARERDRGESHSKRTNETKGRQRGPIREKVPFDKREEDSSSAPKQYARMSRHSIPG